MLKNISIGVIALVLFFSIFMTNSSRFGLLSIKEKETSVNDEKGITSSKLEKPKTKSSQTDSISNKQRHHTMLTYPNPASDKLFVNDTRVSSIVFRHVSGKYKETVVVQNGHASIKEIRKGLYFIELKDHENRYIASQKLIKQ